VTRLVGAIDQGTTSTRFAVVDERGHIVAMARREHRQITPRPGWVEHDPVEILENTEAVIVEALAGGGLRAGDLAAVGITNQRETTVAWSRATGAPLGNAIVWQDTRTDARCRELAAGGGEARFRELTGLPPATYFSGPKMEWILREVAHEPQDVALGTIDAWLAWHLTGEHVTDVTNASRTMLMGLRSLTWEDELLDTMGVPRGALPRIVPSIGVVGPSRGPLAGVPLAGMLGDQQAALFGQAGFDRGDAKNTYGTGCFLLLNTGTEPVRSTHGLLTTVAYRRGREPARYALEGSVAIAGAAVQWLRDNLGLISDAAEVEALAAEVPDNGGVYFVPAFSGLFAPYWRSDARGVIVGLTRFAGRGHLARATLEATAYQTRDVLEAMEADAGIRLERLQVDGGMVVDDLLMQFQADVLGVPVVRPTIVETTVLGAAYAAGLGVGVWSDLDELRRHGAVDRRFRPAMDVAERERLLAGWRKAVERSFGWL